MSVWHSWGSKLQELILLDISTWEFLSRNCRLGAEPGYSENYSAVEGEAVGMAGALTAKAVWSGWLVGWLNSEHIFPLPGSWFRGSAQSIIGTGHVPSLWSPQGPLLASCRVGAGTRNHNHREIAHWGEIIFFKRNEESVFGSSSSTDDCQILEGRSRLLFRDGETWMRRTYKTILFLIGGV